MVTVGLWVLSIDSINVVDMVSLSWDYIYSLFSEKLEYSKFRTLRTFHK